MDFSEQEKLPKSQSSLLSSQEQRELLDEVHLLKELMSQKDIHMTIATAVVQELFFKVENLIKKIKIAKTKANASQGIISSNENENNRKVIRDIEEEIEQFESICKNFIDSVPKKKAPSITSSHNDTSLGIADSLESDLNIQLEKDFEYLGLDQPYQQNRRAHSIAGFDRHSKKKLMNDNSDSHSVTLGETLEDSIIIDDYILPMEELNTVFNEAIRRNQNRAKKNRSRNSYRSQHNLQRKLKKDTNEELNNKLNNNNNNNNNNNDDDNNNNKVQQTNSNIPPNRNKKKKEMTKEIHIQSNTINEEAKIEDQTEEAIKENMNFLPNSIFPSSTPSYSDFDGDSHDQWNNNSYEYFVKMNDTLSIIAETINHQLPLGQETYSEELKAIHQDVQQLSQQFLKLEAESKKDEKETEKEAIKYKEEMERRYQEELSDINLHIKDALHDISVIQESEEKALGIMKEQLHTLIDLTMENGKKQEQWIQVIQDQSEKQEKFIELLTTLLL
jgi:hypothetical protein